MKENEKEEPPVTDADLARVAELDAYRRDAGNPFSQRVNASDALADLCPRIARELIAARAQIAADAEKLKVAREIIHKLVERRTDPHGFYYVTKHMGGLGSILSHEIESALTQLDAKP